MRENSILKKRILQYLENKGVSKYECYQNTGITNGVLSQKNGITEDNILKFLSYYNDINPDWLLTGRGGMLRDDTEKQVPTPSPEQPEILSYLEKQLKEKEKEIGELNQEIGRLKALITVLEEGGEGFKDVEDAGVADVG